MAIEIHVPQPVTRQRILKSMEAPGRHAKRVAGGWIADFVALKRAIMLCPFCTPKFNPRANHYEHWRRDIWSTARCDGCNQFSTHIKTFIHQSQHHDVGAWDRPRRRGRWAKG